MTTNTPADEEAHPTVNEETDPSADEETDPPTDAETCLTADDEVDDIIHGLPDGAGCTEIWEHLSERRDADTQSE